MYMHDLCLVFSCGYNTHYTYKEQLKWAKNSPAGQGFLIENFRIAAEMTQKELADKCGLNESTIRNYELGNRYPDEATLLNNANNLGVSFLCIIESGSFNIFSALHVLFDIEWAYGLRPTIKDSEVCFKFEKRLPKVPVPAHRRTLTNFKRWLNIGRACETKLEDGEITETEYYLKVNAPMNPIGQIRNILFR